MIYYIIRVHRSFRLSLSFYFVDKFCWVCNRIQWVAEIITCNKNNRLCWITRVACSRARPNNNSSAIENVRWSEKWSALLDDGTVWVLMILKLFFLSVGCWRQRAKNHLTGTLKTQCSSLMLLTSIRIGSCSHVNIHLLCDVFFCCEFISVKPKKK